MTLKKAPKNWLKLKMVRALSPIKDVHVTSPLEITITAAREKEVEWQFSGKLLYSYPYKLHSDL